MADDRRGPLVIGVLTAVTGAVLFLAAGDVIPLPDTSFGAPRWLVAFFALGLFFGGGYAVSLALPTPRMRQALGGAAGLAFLTASALLFTWLAVTGGGRRSSVSPHPDTLVLPAEVGHVIVRAFFWLLAIPIDALTLVAWVIAVRWVVRRPSP
ncbi:MAG: hypothetical protein ACREK4_09590 [Candidatus Rokuibacteriota bacterium]